MCAVSVFVGVLNATRAGLAIAELREAESEAGRAGVEGADAAADNEGLCTAMAGTKAGVGLEGATVAVRAGEAVAVEEPSFIAVDFGVAGADAAGNAGEELAAAAFGVSGANGEASLGMAPALGAVGAGVEGAAASALGVVVVGFEVAEGESGNVTALGVLGSDAVAVADVLSWLLEAALSVQSVLLAPQSSSPSISGSSSASSPQPPPPPPPPPLASAGAAASTLKRLESVGGSVDSLSVETGSVVGFSSGTSAERVRMGAAATVVVDDVLVREGERARAAAAETVGVLPTLGGGL
jgi:hypothetical protein